MTAEVLAGAQLAAAVRARTTEEAARLSAAGRPPQLAVVVATADRASACYVRSIARAASEVGVRCDVVDLGPAASAEQIHGTLVAIGADADVHGLVLQTPLPPGVDGLALVSAIPPSKDIDGANPESLGRLAAGLAAFAPATAEAVVRLLDDAGVDLAGRHAVVVGRSTVVGKPLAHLLLDRHATVTICHSRTRQLADHTRVADVLVAAVGRLGLITGEHVSPGMVVVDVGTYVCEDGSLVGDVDAATVEPVVARLTPVPGGVGPVTTALLLEHTVRSAGR